MVLSRWCHGAAGHQRWGPRNVPTGSASPANRDDESLADHLEQVAHVGPATDRLAADAEVLNNGVRPTPLLRELGKPVLLLTQAGALDRLVCGDAETPSEWTNWAAHG